MSNNHTSGSDGGVLNNGSSLVSRREIRAGNNTGALPLLNGTSIEHQPYTPPGTFNFEQMVLSLRDLFEQDRQIASQTDTTRCGLCYLHFHQAEMHYQEQGGYYICKNCEQTLGSHTITMLHRQQKI